MILRTRIAPALFAVTLIAGCAGARPAPAPPTGPSLARQVLTNGVTVVIEPRPGDDVVALQLWVRAGSRDESASELGLAHYLEHMLFKGTPTRPRGTIGNSVEAVGGRMNAATSLDHTFYQVTVPARHVGFAIDLLADVASNAALDADTLEAEKQVVLEELRQREDAPRLFLGRRLQALVFRDHVYGRPVIGERERILALARDTLLGFYRAHYVPEAFVLVVVGPVTTGEIVARAKRSFGRLTRSGSNRLRVAPPSPLQPRREEVTRPLGHAYLGMSWQAPRVQHADMPAFVLLASILGQGVSSRLTEALLERSGLVSAIAADYTGFEARGIFTVTAQLDASKLPAAEIAILDEIRRVRNDGVTEEERRRAAIRAEAGEEFAAEVVEARASRLGRAETAGRLEDELAAVDRIRSVTLEQIVATARRYLDPGRYVRLSLVPAASRSPSVR